MAETVRLSPSAIATFSQCPRKFYYSFVEKLPTKPTVHLVRGRILHKVLEDFFGAVSIAHVKQEQHWKETWEDFRKLMFELLEKEWAQIGSPKYPDCFESEGQKAEFKEETEEFLDFYCAKLAYALHNKLKTENKESQWFQSNIQRHFYPKDREYKLELEDENFVGIIDKTMSLYGKGMAIVDYKTSKSELPHSISERDLKQCKAYAFLWNAKFQEIPKFVSIFYLRDGESVYYPISQRDLDEIEADVKNIRAREKEKPKFELKPQHLCKYCDFFSKCYTSEEEFQKKFEAAKLQR